MIAALNIAVRPTFIKIAMLSSRSLKLIPETNVDKIARICPLNARCVATRTTPQLYRTPTPKLPKTPLDNTVASLKDLHNVVQTHMSLDVWSLATGLFAFIAGPTVWWYMKNSSRSEEEYDLPDDDPVEHSVRILIENTRPSELDPQLAVASPEEDVKRLINDVLASDNIRKRASNIASGVVQSEAFQKACKVLVKNLWNDLVNDPETTKQLTTLVYTVLQNERMYKAVKDLFMQLINDDEVYRELTRLVVKIGEEPEVLDATQNLLSKSAHNTLNDRDVLEHSMEFATVVVGDDAVQRTGGDAIWNSFNYAIQPGGNTMLTGAGTLLALGAIYFYCSKGSDATHIISPQQSFNISPDSTKELSPQKLFESPARKESSCGSISGSSRGGSIFTSIADSCRGICRFPAIVFQMVKGWTLFLVGFPNQVIATLLNLISLLEKVPSRILITTKTEAINLLRRGAETATRVVKERLKSIEDFFEGDAGYYMK
mmetsp:Transcript_31002/g.73927  ORF Transcript_31002/g.73927 Transcript_31002/m.73927 type:complete len:488 (-) Transcript_31002:3-1466(-)